MGTSFPMRGESPPLPNLCPHGGEWGIRLIGALVLVNLFVCWSLPGSLKQVDCKDLYTDRVIHRLDLVLLKRFIHSILQLV